MKQHSYETTLKETAAPAPDPAARLRAKRAALAEFARVNADQVQSKPGRFQALLGALRLSRDDSSHGAEQMNWAMRTRFLAGAASVCVVVIGFAVVWPMVRDGSAERLLEKSPAESVTPEPVRSETSSPAVAAVETTAAVPESAAVAPDLRATEKRLQTAPAQTEPESKKENEQAAAPTPSDDALLAQTEKKDAREIDAITAEDIGKLPDTDVAEALQRTPGVSITRSPPPAPTAVQERNRDEVIVTGSRQSAVRGEVHKGAAAPAGSSRGIVGFSGSVANIYDPRQAPPPPPEGRDKFESFSPNAVKQVAEEPVSTFSADVDTSSYSFVRRQLNAGVLPQKDAVRAEEMINYFGYSWPVPASREQPFKPTVVVSDSPWNRGRKLVHIGIKGYELSARQRPDANLVLLLDVSGSMSAPDKLPLVKDSMREMLGGLKPADTVAIVVYAGAAGTVLPPTPVSEKDKILAALESLSSGGSTAGAQGIELAYQLAESSFRKDGVNRILLCTDGDFNVGINDTKELKGFVERKREKGIFLSVLGFGQGNYRDELAQALAQNGNGVAAYIDTLNEARKVLVQEAGSSLFTIAKDVKLQVEFNPATVAEYRLVGYETRALKREDFNNDAVDAGDVGSGHTVTAIYEITPVDAAARAIDESRYTDSKPVAATAKSSEYGFLKIRYKLPESTTSQLIEQPISIDSGRVPGAIQTDVQFSTAVAGFAQLLRGSQYTGSLTYDDVIRQALGARGEDAFGYRNEFVQLVRRAKSARGM